MIIDVEATLASARAVSDDSAKTRDIAMIDTRRYRTTSVSGGELTVESDRRVAAWFPDALERVAQTDRVVAGARDGHVFILHLDGFYFPDDEQADTPVEGNPMIKPRKSASPFRSIVQAVLSFFRYDKGIHRGKAASGPT